MSAIKGVDCNLIQGTVSCHLISCPLPTQLCKKTTSNHKPPSSSDYIYKPPSEFNIIDCDILKLIEKPGIAKHILITTAIQCVV